MRSCSKAKCDFMAWSSKQLGISQQRSSESQLCYLRSLLLFSLLILEPRKACHLEWVWLALAQFTDRYSGRTSSSPWRQECEAACSHLGRSENTKECLCQAEFHPPVSPHPFLNSVCNVSIWDGTIHTR